MMTRLRTWIARVLLTVVAVLLAIGYQWYSRVDTRSHVTQYGGWPPDQLALAHRLGAAIVDGVGQIPTHVDYVQPNTVCIAYVNPRWGYSAGMSDTVITAKTILPRLQRMTATEVWRLMGPGAGGSIDSVEVTVDSITRFQYVLGRYGTPKWTAKTAFRRLPTVTQAGAVDSAALASPKAVRWPKPLTTIRPLPHNDCLRDSQKIWLTSRAAAVFVVAIDGAGVWLETAIVARGRPNWKSEERQVPRFVYPYAARVATGYLKVTGAAIDTMHMYYDDDALAAWLGARRVQLGDDNVVLFDHADGVGGEPKVLPLVRVGPKLGPVAGDCIRPAGFADSLQRAAAVRAALLSDSTVRAFVER